MQQAVRGVDATRPYPVTSVRAGAIPGIHRLAYDGPCETITLEHVARSRDGVELADIADTGHPLQVRGIERRREGRVGVHLRRVGTRAGVAPGLERVRVPGDALGALGARAWQRELTVPELTVALSGRRAD